MAPFTTEVANFTWTCTHQQITLLPTSTEGLSIPPALLFTKDQTQEIMIVVIATKSKRRKKIEGVNSRGNMNRGPMMSLVMYLSQKTIKRLCKVNKSKLGN